MEEKDYLDDYEVRLCLQLLQLVREKITAVEPRLAPDRVFDAPDLQELWPDVAAPYCGDAIRDMQDYPTVALGWMMYVGMALAHKWDEDWCGFRLGHPQAYEYLRDLRGWDTMDEAIREDVLGLIGTAFDACEDLVRLCAQQALTLMRHEQIEPQTPMAYHVFLRTLRALYRIGITVELKRLGYTVEMNP